MRKDAIEAIARDLVRWGNVRQGPRAIAIAKQAVATLELEGYLSFAANDTTGA